MRVTIIYNQRPEGIDRNDPKLEKHIEGDEWKTIEAIGEAVEHAGHQVMYEAASEDTYDYLKKNRDQIDLVLNLGEGIGLGADREAHVPMLCEILGIPYTGPAPLSAAVILNKTRAKEIWKTHGVRTASWQIFQTGQEKIDETLHFPLIVKPNGEGSGIGIKNDAIVNNERELKRAVLRIVKDYHQPAIVETYLSGREFTVALLGNGSEVMTLPIVEINFAAFPDGTPAIDSYEAKFIYGATGQIEMTATEFCPAQIPKKLQKTIEELAKHAYTSIGCRDFGRVDIRLDKAGEPHVLEINYPPGLMSDPEESSFYTIAARAAGIEFPELISRIITIAAQRLKK